MVSRWVQSGLLVLLAAVASGDQTGPWFCGNLGARVTPYVFTMEGKNKLAALMTEPLKVVMWDETDRESELTCAELDFSTPSQFTYSFYENGALQSHSGSVEVETRNDDYFYLELDFDPDDDFTEGLLGTDGGKQVRMAPLYIGDNELIMLGCDNILLGHRDVTYVLTTEDGLMVDETCGADAVRALLPDADLETLNSIGYCPL